ncbi:Structural maintenance of chromosome protein SMC5/Spr18, SMC superfamily, partial [Pseudoloma neurophilia]
MYEEFKNGSIISLSLKNFQTYSSAYFQFHPKLNFIAGPNGAGKSTLANAIAFIFGGTPRALGKGKDLTDFIKFDTTEATIEILLKIDEKRTVNIKRIISNFKNGTLWFLDNILTKWTKISELYENLKIDISNFCNYLPQEKVSEFSKCSPEELFKIFIEIYSDKKIEKNIEKLKRLEINLEIIKNDKNKIIKEKETVEKAINHMIKDIKKIKEKEELEKRLKLMKEKKNWIIYENEKKEYLKIKEKKEKIKKEIKNIEKENLEIEKEIKKEKENNKGIKKLEEKKEEIKKLNKNFLEKEEKIKNLEIEKEKNKLKIKINEKKREKEKNKIKELKKEKEEKEEKIKKIKIPEKPKKINYEKRDKIEKEINENKKNILKIKEKNKKIKKEIENLKNEKNILKNFELQRLEFLKKYHKETWKAVNWLRNNKEKFKEEIYEPLIMTLFIKEEKYILEIEGTITFQASISFIVKNHEDFIKFTKIMKEEKNWGINVVEQ